MRKKWTNKELAYLREHYLTETNHEMAGVLGKSTAALQATMRRMGLKRPVHISNEMKYRRPDNWTERENEILRQNYLDKTSTELGKLLGRTGNAVKNRIRNLNLCRPDAVRRELQMRGAFKPGHVPANKGKKGWSPPGCEKGWFPKGHLPINTLYDGAIVVRHSHKKRGAPPYKWIRLAKNNWQELHRYYWQQKYGPIPDGMLVRFKNGDTLDCEPDCENLELIDHAQHMDKNRNYEHASERMREIWASGRMLESDLLVSSYITRDPEEKQELIKNHPNVLAAKRLALKLKKEAHNALEITR